MLRLVDAERSVRPGECPRTDSEEQTTRWGRQGPRCECRSADRSCVRSLAWTGGLSGLDFPVGGSARRLRGREPTEFAWFPERVDPEQRAKVASDVDEVRQTVNRPERVLRTSAVLERSDGGPPPPGRAAGGGRPSVRKNARRRFRNGRRAGNFREQRLGDSEMAKNVGDKVRDAVTQVVRDATQNLGSGGTSKSNGPLFGMRGVAEGAGLAALVPLATKGASKAVKRLAAGGAKNDIEMHERETGAWRGVIEDGELVEDHDPSYDEERAYGEAGSPPPRRRPRATSFGRVRTRGPRPRPSRSRLRRKIPPSKRTRVRRPTSSDCGASSARPARRPRVAAVAGARAPAAASARLAVSARRAAGASSDGDTTKLR